MADLRCSLRGKQYQTVPARYCSRPLYLALFPRPGVVALVGLLSVKKSATELAVSPPERGFQAKTPKKFHRFEWKPNIRKRTAL